MTALRAAASVALLGAGIPALAQDWSVDLHAGQASYQAAPTPVASTNAVLGLRHALDRRFFHLSLAAPVSKDDLLWGAVALGDRLAWRRGRVNLGVDLLGQGHVFRDPSGMDGIGGRAEALPMASVSVGPLIGELASGGSAYLAAIGGEPWTRNLWISELRLLSLPHEAIQLRGTARHLRGVGEAYTLLGVSAAARIHRVRLRVSAGEWVGGLEAGVPSTRWGVGASVRVARGLDLWGSLGHEPFDPLVLVSARTAWSAGISWAIGPRRPPAPAAGAEVRGGERVHLRLPLAEAASPPSVAGDFSDWEPIPMHRHGTHWRATVRLEPGAYRYTFRSADGRWFVPEGVPNRVEDGFGGWSAVLVVP